MWASTTCYSKLYGADNFRKRAGASSFEGTTFDQELTRFCRDRGISAIVDIGSGGGALRRAAEAIGFKVIACDYMPSHPSDLHFDLSQNDLGAYHAFRNELSEKFPEKEYVTVCLDVLEHLDPEDVHSAAFNLFDVTHEFLIVSISTRPSGHEDVYHSTILPLPTWCRVLQVAGFEIFGVKFIEEDRQPSPKDRSDPTPIPATHWIKANVFNDCHHRGPAYVLLKKRTLVNRREAKSVIDGMLDVTYRKMKRALLDGVTWPNETVAFNLHHIQDFFNCRPLFDILPRERCVVFMRKSFFRSDEKQLISRVLRRCGVTLIQYDRVQEIDWRTFQIGSLISTGESSAAISHVLSSQFVEASKINGIRTILLQHGIWVEPFADRQILFSSDYVLSWGREHEEFFEKKGHLVAGNPATIGDASFNKFIVAGSPKFCDSTIQPNSDVLRWRLGVETSRYRDVILVGTNRFWGAHHASSKQIISDVRAMIDENPEILFIVKPHPAERFDEYAAWKAPNCIVIDDILLGCMDLPIARLLGGVSTVVSSLSTLLLDGAAAGKRCIQYDTDATFSYIGCRPLATDALKYVVRDKNTTSFANVDFKRHYNDADNGAFYATLLKTMTTPPPEVNPAMTSYSLLKSTEDAWCLYQDGLETSARMKTEQEILISERDELAFEKEALVAEREALVAEKETLIAEKERLLAERDLALTELKGAKSAVKALVSSHSWRMTAPFRKAKISLSARFFRK